MSRFSDDKPRRDMFDAIDQVVDNTDLRDTLLAYRTPGAAEKILDTLAEKAKTDPLVLQWVKQIGTPNRPVFISEPWEALAEQRAVVFDIATNRPTILDGFKDQNNNQRCAELAAAIWLSQTYLWKASVLAIARSCPLPTHVVTGESMPFPFCYHTFDGAITALDVETHEEMGLTDWLHFHYAGHGMNITTPCTKDGVMQINKCGIEFNQTFPDDFPVVNRPAISGYLAMLAFLRSEYIDINQRKLPRQFRRGNGVVAGTDIQDRTINVVELRRTAQDAVEAFNAESKEFRHRWWVSGHFRSQWFPSTKTHALVWIAPYLKGRPDAPMLEKVYAVRR